MTEADTPETSPRFRSDMTVELVKHSASDTDVLWAARVSTAGEQSLDELQKDPERSKGLINYLMRDRHGSPFEHNSMTFFVSAPLFVFREFHRHRVGWCLAGDTEITVAGEGEGFHRKTIAELHQQWHSGVAGTHPPSAGGATWHGEERPTTRARELGSVRRHHVRCYDEDALTARRARIVDVFASGTKPLLKIVTRSGRALRCSPDHAVFTPDGWRKAGELTAGDSVMADGTAPRPGERSAPARTDCHGAKDAGEPARGGGGGQDSVAVRDEIARVTPDGEEETYDLSVEGPWHNFLAGGIVVHNSYNEESGRYRELQPVFYVPDASRKLVQQGRPGKYEFVEGTPEQLEVTSGVMQDSHRQAYEAYRQMLDAGVAREVARAVLPVGLYSSMYATCNARSLMHFLGLRTRHEQARVPSFPQREIEMVAEQMEARWAELMPLTYAAFNKNGRVAP